MFHSVGEVTKKIEGAISKGKEAKLVVTDVKRLTDDLIDSIIYNAVFNGDAEVRKTCEWLVHAAGRAMGIVPSSIQGFYEAMGKGEVKGFTVPAINIRGLTYDSARAVFRAARKNNTGAVIFEIAKSEIQYTDQRPAEYAAVIMAAAIKEGVSGPVFIQGDHFQLNAKNFGQDPQKEIDGIKSLISEAIKAGFYNIDIDASTLVDLSKPTLKEQQNNNYSLTADLTAYIRENEPHGITISVGGEIGEVGGKNSTVDELRAFMENYKASLRTRGEHLTGISKISVQTGTTHGGIPLPDGTIAKVKLDFGTLENLSNVARKEFGLSGAVQHGASTLPDEAFDKFPATTTAEIHLATGFQNIIYESTHFPSPLKDRIYSWLAETCAKEKKEGETEEQFIYKTRKKGFGSFKQQMWDLPADIRGHISEELENKFDFLFRKLNAVNTRGIVKRYVTPVEVNREAPPGFSL